MMNKTKSFRFFYTILAVALVCCLAILTLVACDNSGKSSEDSSLTMTFVVDGEVYKTVTVQVGENLTLPDNPTKEGYDFAGWFLDEELTTVPDVTKMEGKVTLYAKFVKGGSSSSGSGSGLSSSFTVTFVVDGKPYDTMTIRAGGSLTIPENPTKEGYAFEGWYLDEGTFERAFDGIVTGSVTLYAKFAKDKENQDHNHTYDWVSGETANCQREGVRGHYVCYGCGKTFDENYVETEDFTIQKTEHFFQEHYKGYPATCEYNGEKEYQICAMCRGTFDMEGNPLDSIVIHGGHIYGDWIEGKDATCTEEGVVGHYQCERCNNFFDENHDRIYDVTIPMQHDKEWVDMVDNTCTEDGMYGHYRCTRCGACFNDYGEVLDASDLVIPASHSFWYLHDANEPDCWYQGNVAYYKCERCGKYFDEDKNYLGDDQSAVILPYRHSGLSEWVPGVEVTCTTNGQKGYYYCSNCYRYFDEEMHEINQSTLVITATGHNFEGNTCTKCGKTLTPSADLSVESNGDGTCKILGIGSCEDTDLVIPQTIGGDTVVEIAAEAFKDCTDLTLISVPESVNKIGRSAFAGCASLETLILPFVGECRTVEKDYDNNKKLLGYMFANEYFEGSYQVQQSYKYSNYYNSFSAYLPTSLTGVVILGGDTMNSFYRCTNLTSVVLGAGVETVGDSTFYACRNLCSVVLREGVKRIGNSVFEGCDQLSEISLPSSLEYIGETKFSSRATLAYEGGNYVGNEENPYLVMTAGARVIHEDTKFIARDAFNPNRSYEVNGIETVTLPDGLIGICAYAFNYSTVKTIALPSSLRYLGIQAFGYCRSLTEIEIPTSVTEIGKQAFQGCVALQKATIGGSLASDLMFEGCSLLETVTITEEGPETTIGEYAFRNTPLVSLVLPARVTSIGRDAFNGVETLTTVQCKGNIQSVGFQAFYMCKALETFDGAPKVVGYSAFNNCQSLKNFNFENVTQIGDYAFLSCFALESIDLPETLSDIGEYAFSGCRSVESITGVDTKYYTYVGNCIISGGHIVAGCKNSVIPQDDSVTWINSGAFANLDITTLRLPASVVWVGEQAFYGCPLETITVAEGNKYYEAINNCLIYKSDKKLVLGTCNSVIPTDPEVVDTIGTYAFARNFKLKSITIPSNIKNIYDGAFEYSGLQVVDLPDSVTYLGTKAFRCCHDLTEVKSLGGVIGLNDQTFEDCPSLTDFHIGANVNRISGEVFGSYYDGTRTIPQNIYLDYDLATYFAKTYHNNLLVYEATFYLDGEPFPTEIVIPDDMTTIKNYLFRSLPITSVVIPVSVTRIGSAAFAQCKALTDITYEGTLDQWNSITKEYGWTEGITVTVHCAGGEEVEYKSNY